MRFVLPYIKNSTLIYMSVEKMANDSNFDRNPSRGCNYGLEGGAFLILGGATTALGGALLYPWGQQ